MYEPSLQSPHCRLFSFLRIPLLLQAKVLQQGLHRKAVGSLGEGRQSPAMKAWCGVERNLRSALRRNYASSFLQELEVRRLFAWPYCIFWMCLTDQGKMKRLLNSDQIIDFLCLKCLQLPFGTKTE